MGIERVASRIDRWRRRPRFRAPISAIVLPLLLAAGLAVSLTPTPSAPPAPSVPVPRASEPLRPLPEIAPPAPPPAPPAETTEIGCPHGCTEPPLGCAIKGNISMRTGERIYHLPGQRYYDATVISPAQGERWFCTEAEAQENRWRKSKR